MVMTDGHIIIGASSFCQSRISVMESFGEIVSLYVLPDYTGKGYGRVLLNAAINELRKLGFEKLYLWTFAENVRAKQFYAKCGLIETDIFKEERIGGKIIRVVQYRLENNFLPVDNQPVKYKNS